MESLETIGTYVDIGDNLALVDLSGLSSLVSIGQFFHLLRIWDRMIIFAKCIT